MSRDDYGFSNNSINSNYPFYAQQSHSDHMTSAVVRPSMYSNFNWRMEENRQPYRYFNNQPINMNARSSNTYISAGYNGCNGYGNGSLPFPMMTNNGSQSIPICGSYCDRNGYVAYYNDRPGPGNTYPSVPFDTSACGHWSSGSLYPQSEHSVRSASVSSSSNSSSASFGNRSSEQTNSPVSLQISNIDYSLNENILYGFLMEYLKPITRVLALIFDGNFIVKVTVPNMHFAKKVVSSLHRKKIGHKRISVAYVRESSSTEVEMLRCQIAGLLKDIPQHSLQLSKFREIFQSRFKTSISYMDITKVSDVCSITTDTNDEKFISLNPDLIKSIDASPLKECLTQIVPYCMKHFKHEPQKGWAEQEIEPLPNVFMTIAEIQGIIYPLLKNHKNDIPVASLVHCVRGELGIEIIANEKGVNLEHLICCVQGIQITVNDFGIKILGWLEPKNAITRYTNDGRGLQKFGTVSDPLHQISRETVELIKMSPKATMNFNRFIPAYHNHFGKQCRVADYGYTRLIELFEALSSVIQVMGDGDNRQLTLNHRVQIRRFTADLLRVLRLQASKSILLSELPVIFTQTMNHKFDITDYGICDINDILDGLANSNTVVIKRMPETSDILISMPKRRQTPSEIEKTCIFAEEVVELFQNAAQYAIRFIRFVRSYHHHFGYQCRLSDYGHFKLADLMESLQGIIEIKSINDEDKLLQLTFKVARRVFSEQIETVVEEFTGCPQTCFPFDSILQLHKKKFGYQFQPQTIGFNSMLDAIMMVPYVELMKIGEEIWIICHGSNQSFRQQMYRGCLIVEGSGKDAMSFHDFINEFFIKHKERLSEQYVAAMKLLLEIKTDQGGKYITLTDLTRFLFRIVRVIGQRYMTLQDIDSALHLSVTDCFKYGYPSLYTLLRAFPDIFNIQQGSSRNRCEISLNARAELFPLSNAYQQPPQSITSQIPVIKIESANYQESSSLDQTSPISDEKNNSCLDIITTSNFLDISQKENTSYTSAFSHGESFYNSSFIESYNSSLLYDSNTSASGSASSGYCGGDGSFWNKRHDRNYRDSNNNNNVVIPLGLDNYFGSLKSGSPPNQDIPFWLDPIWKTPKQPIDLVGDTSQINILSPYDLSKWEHDNQKFSFPQDT